MIELKDQLKQLLLGAGLHPSWLNFLTMIILLVAMLLLAIVFFVLAHWLIVKIVYKLLRRTRTRWDDVLIEHKVFSALTHLVPVMVIKSLVPVVFSDYPGTLPFFMKLTDVYLVMVIVRVILSFLRGTESHLSLSKLFVDKPIASYFQLGRMIIFIATGILILSILLGKSPLYFLGAFGAMTAIILLIFKDTILGLVASVQISANDMIRVGDWVEMPKYNADGDVIAINLNTVKIRNWDKTISTIPTYYFISDSFKNWRGMQESGGRRIKRSIHIDLGSIKFVNQDMRERFSRFYLIKDLVQNRQKEIEQYNHEHQVDEQVLINGRRMTNIGVFRYYTEAYLQHHPQIRQDMTLIVRQQTPTQYGLPIEIYCFTTTTQWNEYEAIQSDIFDHLLAAAGQFDLKVFQSPGGGDILQAGKQLEQLMTSTPKKMT